MTFKDIKREKPVLPNGSIVYQSGHMNSPNQVERGDTRKPPWTVRTARNIGNFANMVILHEHTFNGKNGGFTTQTPNMSGAFNSMSRLYRDLIRGQPNSSYYMEKPTLWLVGKLVLNHLEMFRLGVVEGAKAALNDYARQFGPLDVSPGRVIVNPLIKPLTRIEFLQEEREIISFELRARRNR